MAADLSQLDSLEELDIMEALGESTQNIDKEEVTIEDEILIEDIDQDEILIENVQQDEILIEDMPQEEIQVCEMVESEEVDEIEESVEIDDVIPEIIEEKKDEDISINTDSLASLLSQLLNNKTIEITIKIKD